MYIPEETIDLAMNRGYTVTLNPREFPGASMQCGKRHIWRTHKGWQTADLLPRCDGTGQFYYTNHKTFDDPSDALRREFT